MSSLSGKDKPSGEIELIRNIIANLPAGRDVVIAPGDDCASVRANPDEELILTSDPVILDTHFDSSATPEQIGHKAVGRVLSDLAAMGASPRWILLNTAAPPDYPQASIRALIDSAQHLASRFGASIVGGDISSSSILAVNAFACGTLPSGSAVLRKGALPGHEIYVSGRLGDSRAGKHLNFTPRVKEGIWIREHGFASSMIDTSDGPATDLRHILEASQACAALQLTAIPCTQSLARLDLPKRVARALCDGEDFELLFTVPSDLADTLEAKWREAFDTELSRIGSITAGKPQIIIVDQDGQESIFSGKGFDHYDENKT